jgi:hypothetical protein
MSATSFTESDEIFLYDFHYKEVIIPDEISNINYIETIIYNTITPLNLVLQVSSGSSGSCGQLIMDQNIRVLTYSKLPNSVIRELQNQTTYKFTTMEKPIWHSMQRYKVKDVSLLLILNEESGEHSRCGCAQHKNMSVSLIGWPKRDYMTPLSDIDSGYICKLGASQWNYKPNFLKKWIREITPHSVRTASLMCDKQEILCLGFGW